MRSARPNPPADSSYRCLGAPETHFAEFPARPPTTAPVRTIPDARCPAVHESQSAPDDIAQVLDWSPLLDSRQNPEPASLALPVSLRVWLVLPLAKMAAAADTAGLRSPKPRLSAPGSAASGLAEFLKHPLYPSRSRTFPGYASFQHRPSLLHVRLSCRTQDRPARQRLWALLFVLTPPVARLLILMPTAD